MNALIVWTVMNGPHGRTEISRVLTGIVVLGRRFVLPCFDDHESSAPASLLHRFGPQIPRLRAARLPILTNKVDGLAGERRLDVDISDDIDHIRGILCATWRKSCDVFPFLS